MKPTNINIIPRPHHIHGKTMGVLSRAVELPTARAMWKATGNAQPHWGRKYEGDNPLVVTRNLGEDGFAIAVPLPIPGERMGVDTLLASTGTYRFLSRREMPRETWDQLVHSSWNGHYFKPVPEPWGENRPPLVHWSSWN
jgi:hypothetical protein